MSFKTTMIALAGLLLSACASAPAILPAEKVVLQDHDVQVLVARQAPPEVVGCWASLPAPPQLQDAPGGLLVPTDQVESFKLLLRGYRACDDGWRAWATSK
jgi:hypothetical protein